MKINFLKPEELKRFEFKMKKEIILMMKGKVTLKSNSLMRCMWSDLWSTTDQDFRNPCIKIKKLDSFCVFLPFCATCSRVTEGKEGKKIAALPTLEVLHCALYKKHKEHNGWIFSTHLTS